MSRYSNPYPEQIQNLDYARAGLSVASFMNAVYAWMCVGLATTAVVGWWTASQERLLRQLCSGGTLTVLIIAELALVWVISAAIEKISTGLAIALFLTYSALNGLVLSAIFMLYSLDVIGAAFAVTAGMFAVMSVIGFVTRRDLSTWGSLLVMALIGLVIASIVNLFWANSEFHWLITYAGVLIFLGLTAYDTQKLKALALSTQGDAALAGRIAVVGSLALYLDFVNLFLFLLRILNARRR